MQVLKSRIQSVVWGLALAVILVSVLVWGEDLNWQFSMLSSYKLFPLFGLMAFGLMWTHYIAAALRKVLKVEAAVIKRYFDLTSLAVLVLILLHPGLLIYQLWSDGFGLPPGSYLENYVASSLKWAVALGSVSLLVFLTYELYRWFKEKRWWRYVQILSDLAMLAILIHGYKLGSHLQTGWFRVVWLVYAVTLVAALGIIYTKGQKSNFNQLEGN